MTMFAWLLTGVLVGFAAATMIIYIIVSYDEHKLTKEEFVKKLVKEKGWTEARWELETAFRGKYMRTWRKLYKKHIEEKDNGKN